MPTVEVAIPEELVTLLKRSRLGDRPVDEQVRIALAIHLMQEGVISVGKAAAVAGMPRASFELELAEIGIPTLRYDIEDLRQDHVQRSGDLPPDAARRRAAQPGPAAVRVP